MIPAGWEEDSQFYFQISLTIHLSHSHTLSMLHLSAYEYHIDVARYIRVCVGEYMYVCMRRCTAEWARVNLPFFWKVYTLAFVFVYFFLISCLLL